MALYYEYKGKADTKKWSKGQLATYQGLALVSVAVALNKLDEENAVEFCRRANALKLYDVTISPNQLTEYYGLKTNAENLTAAAWAIRHFGKAA